MNPYRENTAPPAPDLWDGSRAPGWTYVGSRSNLVVARNGKVYNTDTREEVKMRPLKELIDRGGR